MQSCPLCRAGGQTIHVGAHALLHEALRVHAMRMAEREAYIARALVARGEEAVRGLAAIVESVRASAKEFG